MKKAIIIEILDDGKASIKYSDNLTIKEVATALLEIVNDIILEG